MNSKKLFPALVVLLGLVVLSNIALGLMLFNDLDNNEAEEPYFSFDSANSNAEFVYEQGNSNTVTIYRTGEVTESQGSGFITTDEYIITNNHVISGDSTVDVEFSDNSWTKAEVVGTDPYTDLAVLEPNDIPEDTNGLEFADTVSVSEDLYVIGSPSNLDSTLTTGIVSGTNRSVQAIGDYHIPDMVQTDAALNPGNSGGPMLNSDSEVIAVSQSTLGENIGMGVSASLTQFIYSSLLETGDHQHPLVGVRTHPITPAIANQLDSVNPNSGILLVETDPEQDAHNKLQPYTGELSSEELEDGYPGDIITEVNGVPVSSSQEFSSYLISNYQGGDTVELTVLRNDSEETVTITLGERPEPEDLPN